MTDGPSLNVTAGPAIDSLKKKRIIIKNGIFKKCFISYHSGGHHATQPHVVMVVMGGKAGHVMMMCHQVGHASSS
jgi:hypothetical protein